MVGMVPAKGAGTMLRWIFTKFWDSAPRMGYETSWNCVQEEDAWEGVRYQLERIADALEHWRGMQ